MTARNNVNGVLGLGGLADLASTMVNGVEYVFALGGTDNTLVTFSRDPKTGGLVFLQRLEANPKLITVHWIDFFR